MKSLSAPARVIALAAFGLATGCAPAGPGQDGQQGPAISTRVTYQEQYRPQYHFTPASNWMNDPNGMVYHDGEYHLFYQYNPFGDRWGHMSWGHAVSPDLLHWEHLPVAIPESEGVMAFSGSAVVDWNNTSGFGTADEPPLVAIYTGHTGERQSQYLAYSTDRGRTWTVYDGNPVLDIGLKDFRDPKVFWHDEQERWVMVVALPDQYRVSFYASPDLKEWTHLSDFGPAAAVGGIWECPDLFQLPVDGDPDNTRWVLIVNLNPGSMAGGSGTQYFIGDFDGTHFTAEAPAAGTTSEGMAMEAALWADYGKDFYAAVSWSDIPEEDGRRIWLGWMSNWQYANDIPTSPWRSAQSIPRTLELRTTPEGLRMVQRPVEELQTLRGEIRRIGSRSLPEGSQPLASEGIAGSALEIIAEFEVANLAHAAVVRSTEANGRIASIDSAAAERAPGRIIGGVEQLGEVARVGQLLPAFHSEQARSGAGDERRVACAADLRQALHHLDVGRDAHPLHHPHPFRIEEAELRGRDAAAVHQRRIAGDADEPSPRTRADERTEPAFAEVVGQRIAAG